MISRVAESCFWLNRYVERVEVLSRMLGVNFAFQLDIELAATERWRPLVIVAGQEEDFLKRVEAPQADDGERVQEYLTWNEENPSSVYSSLRAARENARTIRETISLEMWETLNDLWVWLRSKDAHKLYERNRTTFYSRLRDQCLLFHGIAQATMLHEAPFEFMRLGTALERAGQTARVLDVRHHAVGPVDAAEEPPEAIAQWLTILRFCSGVEPFLKRITEEHPEITQETPEEERQAVLLAGIAGDEAVRKALRGPIANLLEDSPVGLWLAGSDEAAGMAAGMAAALRASEAPEALPWIHRVIGLQIASTVMYQQQQQAQQGRAS